ncbi:MAG: ParA family protein [Candidatus Tectomicrobia bacterium]
MIVTVASFKGGQAKTTSAVHIAAYLQQNKPALLIDGDPNRSATGWARRQGLPFRVVDERQAARFAREYEHIVIDTQARPTSEDLRALAAGCDMLIIPVTPDALSLDALFLIVDALEHVGSNRFHILLTIVPPRPSRDGDEARATLEDAKLPVFKTVIRRFVAFQKAALQGVVVSEVADPRARDGWNDYRRVGEELVHGTEQV